MFGVSLNPKREVNFLCRKIDRPGDYNVKWEKQGSLHIVCLLLCGELDYIRGMNEGGELPEARDHGDGEQTRECWGEMNMVMEMHMEIW